MVHLNKSSIGNHGVINLTSFFFFVVCFVSESQCSLLYAVAPLPCLHYYECLCGHPVLEPCIAFLSIVMPNHSSCVRLVEFRLISADSTVFCEKE
jgi:hypothetical protein